MTIKKYFLFFFFLVESINDSNWAKDFFTPVAVVLLFNVCDLFGRSLATYFQWPKISTKSKFSVLIFCILRLGFIPLFMYSNAAPESRVLPVIIR
jgi:hypothetical protein